MPSQCLSLFPTGKTVPVWPVYAMSTTAIFTIVDQRTADVGHHWGPGIAVLTSSWAWLTATDYTSPFSIHLTPLEEFRMDLTTAIPFRVRHPI